MNLIGKNVINFYVRLFYGLALVDFLTVLQFISAPQFQAAWKAGWANHSTRAGLLGMLFLCVNIPLSFGWAMYTDYRAQTGVWAMPRPYVLSLLGAIGVMGIGLTLASFRQFFGFTFIFATLGAAFLFILALRLRMRMEKKPD